MPQHIGKGSHSLGARFEVTFPASPNAFSELKKDIYAGQNAFGAFKKGFRKVRNAFGACNNDICANRNDVCANRNDVCAAPKAFRTRDNAIFKPAKGVLAGAKASRLKAQGIRGSGGEVWVGCAAENIFCVSQTPMFTGLFSFS